MRTGKGQNRIIADLSALHITPFRSAPTNICADLSLHSRGMVLQAAKTDARPWACCRTSVTVQDQLFRRLTLAWDHRYRLSPDLGGCKEHGLSDLLIIFYRLTRRWPRRKESRPYPTLGVFGFRPPNLGGSRDFVLGLLSFYPVFVP